METITIEISGNDYCLCEESSKNMWANGKNGEWGRGLINNSFDERKAERIGRLGEMALSKLFNVNIDLSYRIGGDDRDFMLFKKIKVDAKTAYINYNAGLIKAVHENGRIIPLEKDLYIFSYIEEEDRKLKKANIVVVGGMHKDDIIKREIVPARKGRHYNYDISYEEMTTIKHIYKTYKKYKSKIPQTCIF